MIDESKELHGKIEEIIKNGLKPKMIVENIKAHLLNLEKSRDLTLSPVELHKAISTAIWKGKEAKYSVDPDLTLLEDILLWQSAYYDLNDGIDLEVQRKLMFAWANAVPMYIDVVKDIDTSNIIELFYVAGLNLPLNVNIQQLNRFYDATKLAIEVVYSQMIDLVKESGGIGIMPFVIYHKDVVGDEAAWVKKISRWQRCYYFYVEHYHKKISKTEIVRNINSPFFNSDDLPNSIHKLNSLLKEAEQLKVSAKNGTFPL